MTPAALRTRCGTRRGVTWRFRALIQIRFLHWISAKPIIRLDLGSCDLHPPPAKGCEPEKKVYWLVNDDFKEESYAGAARRCQFAME